jgi:hypothetical protein
MLIGYSLDSNIVVVWATKMICIITTMNLDL